MRQVLLAYAKESAPATAEIKSLRGDLTGNVQLLEPKSGAAGLGTLRPDTVLVFFAAYEDASKAGVPMTDLRVLALDESQRDALPDDATYLVALRTPDDRGRLPKDLARHASFALSVPSEREALLCKLAHEPVKARSRARTEAGIAGFKLTTGIVATAIGSLPKTKDFLTANFRPPFDTIAFYIMVCVVVVLIVTSLYALLRIAVGVLRNLRGKPESAAGPSRPLVLRVVGGVFVLAAVASSVIWLTKPEPLDKMVASHLNTWAQTLKTSQVPNGGIREFHDQGEPQVWTTAQALAGLRDEKLSSVFSLQEYSRAVTFIRSARIDGRPVVVPSFVTSCSPCPPRPGVTEGWGYFEPFNWGVTEIAAWVALAEVRHLRAQGSAQLLTEDEKARARRDIRSIVELLLQRQIDNSGGFSPIVQVDVGFARTYSTIMAVWAIAEAMSQDLGIYEPAELTPLEARMRRAIGWLRSSSRDDGWRANPSNPSSEKAPLGLTAQTLFVLNRIPFPLDPPTRAAFLKISKTVMNEADALSERGMEANARIADSDRYLLPTDRVTEGSTMLWYPWTVALMRVLSQEPSLGAGDQEKAQDLLDVLQKRVSEYGAFAAEQYNYASAEGLIGFTWPIRSPTQAAQSAGR